ncbi:hypothetical protein KFK09_021854 [Dendrobium nobile]|uniref:THO complex subunit 5B n=1 Tax=Dendrobium nobile TaxID=94219 RepID=A0A8T3AH98_DENNO|nr:hypothetical protein KFK09_021854 [Dendrobium nobile]
MEVEAVPAIVKTAHEALDETRRALEDIAAKILFVKKEGKPKSELRELSTQMSLLFITLRQLNRTILVEEDRIKAETESAKAPVDFTTLQLHNLMYEKNHYLKAINTCRDFRSKYSDIELVPEEEFLKNAPEDIKEKVLASDAAHDLMLKRFNYELFQRKELCKLREKLEQHKKSLVETIASRKKFLSSLPSHLKSLKKATLPVQQQLGILHSKKLKQHYAAELLPPPLYIVYSQLLAQKEAFGEKIEMEITGSVKDAQTFSQRQASRETGTSTNMESIRLDDDAPDEEEDVQRRRKRLKKNLPKENGDQGGIHQTHPLKVFVHIFDDDLQPKSPKLMSLKFEYLIKLNVVCVGVEDPEQASDENILCNLFPNDTGTELPHQTAKLYAGDFVAFGDKSTRPYMWAQHLAGMDFLPEVPPLQQHSENLKTEARSANVSSGLYLYRRENRVQTVLQRIRSRKKALMALVEQLNFLVKLKWPLLDNENVPWALHTPLCNLQQWLPVRPVVDSSVSAVTAEKLVGSVGHELDRRSVPPSEIESAREDGELPMALPATVFPDDSSTKISNVSSDLESSRSLTLISKNITPPKMVKSSSFGRNEDDLDLILDMESDVEEKVCIESETDIVGAIEEPWVDHSAREFHLVLCRKDGNEQMLKLEATVKISIEYPLRAPFFKLRLSPDGSQDSFECFNELRAMESEVNLHILNMLSVDSENYVLAHQIRCLAMLFDLHFNTAYEKRKSNSVIDAGLCIPFNDNLLGRVVRGRDRRRMLSWKRIGRNNHSSC